MGQEEHTKKCSTSNGPGGISIGHISSRSSRKQKQKKVPQRGLGVAQLEKIRLEEQQKKDSSSVAPTVSQTKPSNLISLPPIPNYDSASPTSMPYSPPPDLSSPNSMFRPPNIELINSNSIPALANSVGSQSAAVQGQKNINIVPKMWNYMNPDQKENCGVDPAGLAFRPCFNLVLPYKSNPIWPLPSLMQRAQQHRRHSSSCSVVNASSGSLSSSSLQSFQTEPPSNQSYSDNYTYNTPVWIDEEKMVGMKRTYPFSLDSPPCSSFHYKCPTTSFGNGGLYNFSFNNPNCREGSSSCSTSILEPTSKKNIKESGACSGDFLSLAPPATTLKSTNFNLKPSAYLAFHNFEAFDFDSLPYQGDMEDQILQQRGPIVPNHQQAYYCFLPPALIQIGQPTKATIHNCTRGSTGEVGENIDLNLKL